MFLPSSGAVILFRFLTTPFTLYIRRPTVNINTRAMFGIQPLSSGRLLSFGLRGPAKGIISPPFLANYGHSWGLSQHASQASAPPMRVPAGRLFSSSSFIGYRRSRFDFDPPRFNRGPSNGIFSLVPDAMKTMLAVVGGCAFLMVFGPLFFIVVPPLFLGGFFLVRHNLRKRSKGMSERWERLETSQLKFKGTEMDTDHLEKWTKDRVAIALERNEHDIVNNMGLDVEGSHRDFLSRLSLTGPESIDQDIRMNDRIRAPQRITVITYGLEDLDSGSRLTKVGTVTVSLLQHSIADLLDINSVTQNAIIEVQPLSIFKRATVIDTQDSYSSSPFLDIKANRTTRR